MNIQTLKMCRQLDQRVADVFLSSALEESFAPIMAAMIRAEEQMAKDSKGHDPYPGFQLIVKSQCFDSISSEPARIHFIAVIGHHFDASYRRHMLLTAYAGLRDGKRVELEGTACPACHDDPFTVLPAPARGVVAVGFRLQLKKLLGELRRSLRLLVEGGEFAPVDALIATAIKSQSVIRYQLLFQGILTTAKTAPWPAYMPSLLAVNYTARRRAVSATTTTNFDIPPCERCRGLGYGGPLPHDQRRGGDAK